MSKKTENFKIIKKDTTIVNCQFDTQDILEVVVEANNYLVQLSHLFHKMDFDLFQVLGQRNISGVVGEIFSRFFSKKFTDFKNNPHPDGRPDILHLGTEEVIEYYKNECFQQVNGRFIPIKSKLSPFPYEGIEVKCTIGNPKTNYKFLLNNDIGKKEFELGIPRINYIHELNWWAHHTHSRSLLGLYYDYYSQENNSPQILAVFYSTLDVTDWACVSLGSAKSKKTSNTSLNKLGRTKMKQNCLVMIDNPDYLTNLSRIGVSI